MKIVKRKLADLVPYENNPRINEAAVDYVANSLQHFGWQQPIVIDKNNVIIAGHTRYKAALKLGWADAECKIASELTAAQVKEYRLADNKVGEMASWDYDMLGDELAEIEALDDDVDMADFGFAVDALTDDDTGEVEEDDFDEEPPEEPKAKLGDVYQLGNHRLMCGDSTKADDVAKLMGGVLADLLITDPPYNVDYVGRHNDREKIKNDSMEDGEFVSFLGKAFRAGFNALRSGACFYIWHGNMLGHLVRQAVVDAEQVPRQSLVWVKQSFVVGWMDYQTKHEICIYGWKDGEKHKWYGDHAQTTVLEFDRPLKSKLHPTMKPVPLFAYQIANSTQKGDAVLDLFGGSGTTAIACEELGRKAYIMELDPRYVDVIIARWEQHTGQTAKLLKDKKTKK